MSYGISYYQYYAHYAHTNVTQKRRNSMPGFNGGFRKDFGPREMSKATCSDCGKECEVPFKPSGDRPVYCKDCYSKKKKKF